MKAAFETPNHEAEIPPPAIEDLDLREAVHQELSRILASRFFRSAGRSRQFLEYVVRHKLEGHLELLKERTIGTEVFHRPHGYATGDDPVVRVQAGEVRRRLEQYYQAVEDCPIVSIELPLGAYAPNFRWRTPVAGPVPLPMKVESPASAQSPAIVLPPPAAPPAPKEGAHVGRWVAFGLCLCLGLALASCVARRFDFAAVLESGFRHSTAGLHLSGATRELSAIPCALPEVCALPSRHISIGSGAIQCAPSPES
jgi:hypothetical protein